MYVDWEFQCKKSTCLVFVQQCQCDKQSVKQTSQSAALHTATHSPREEDQSAPWKEAVWSFIISVLFDTFFISLTDAPFGVTLPSKHNKKANQVSLIVHNAHTQTHTCQHQWLVRNFVRCFLFPFFLYQRDLTLWPWFQPSRWQHRRQAYIILVLVPVWRACPW